MDSTFTYQGEAARLLVAKIKGSRDASALDAWVRDVLLGASDMTRDLKHARTEAAELRRRADQIESRAVERLVEDITAEWTSAQIRSACKRRLPKR
jgi:hypothetical protein